VGALDNQLNSEFWTGKKVLVTGHTGFKGSWLTYWLKKSGAEVCGLSLNPITTPSLWDEINIDLEGFDLRFDIRGHEWVQKVRSFQPQIVFHLAAQPLVVTGWNQPLLTFDTNVTGTANLLNQLNLIESVSTILVVTTDKVYKLNEKKLAHKEADELGGKDPYSASKVGVEFVVSSWPLRENIRIATARSGNVIGGGDWSEDRLIPDIIRAGFEKSLLEIRNPKAIRPWQHVLEPTYGYLLLAQAMHDRSFAASTINFGPSFENQISVEEIIKYSSELMPSKIHFNEIFVTGKYTESEFLLLESEFARSALNWKPLLSWKEALSLTLEWYVDHREGNTPIALMDRNIAYYSELVGKHCG
jgi:CDP-glucose 4,6-dehydratase